VTDRYDLNDIVANDAYNVSIFQFPLRG